MFELPGWATDAALFVLRVAFGVCSFRHGQMKIGNQRAFATANGLSMPMAYVATFVQVIGSALLVVGLATPIAALGLTLFGLYATFVLIRRGERFVAPGQHSWDTGVLYTAIPLTILLAGPGGWSLDRLLQ